MITLKVLFYMCFHLYLLPLYFHLIRPENLHTYSVFFDLYFSLPCVSFDVTFDFFYSISA